MNQKVHYKALLRLALSICALAPTASQAEFLISEILANNSGSTLSDEDGFPADWIEIQNPDPAASSLAGYHLTDDPADLTKWTLPDVMVGANGYLVVFATGKDRAVAGFELHTNFALGAGGEFLALVKPDGETVVSSFSPEFPEQVQDISYGIGMLSDVAFVTETSTVRYFPPTGEVADWETSGFDDSSWASATNGVGWGYPDLPGGANGSQFEADARLGRDSADRGSVYVRIPFEIENAAEVFSMTMEILYEDGFVIYLNGNEVASSNAPDPLEWSSVTSISIEENDGPDFYPIDFAGHLVDGTNVLAIHAMNNTTGSSDFYLQPQLDGQVQDLSAPEQLGYFEVPTPGTPNGLLSSAPPNLVGFSVPSQAFTDDFQLSLSVENSSAIIRFTEDGSLPNNDPVSPSPQYTGPISIDTSKMIRARAFLTGAIAGPGRSEGYMKLAASEANFSSDLPVVMLSKFSAGDPPGADASTRVDGFMLIYEPDEVTGRTSITGVPSLATRGGYRKRGSSSGGFAKYAMTFESWDEFDEDKDIKPLGFSSEADWILNSRYTFDMALIRNPFLYELSNQVGRWAVETQMIEIYHDATGGDVTSNDYFGVYCFMEKIEPDKGRVDIPNLDPWDDAAPEVTGGYVFKKDRQGPGEETINGSSMGNLPLTDPAELNTAQEDYIEGYLSQMDAVLTNQNSTISEISEYLEIDSFIDNFWLNILAMDPDWGRLSQYFYKDREGLVYGGPIWDYDRTMGSRDGRDDDPFQWYENSSQTWYDGSYPWFGKLFGITASLPPIPTAPNLPQLITTRPDVFQKVIDRWYDLRSSQFSQANMDSIIDAMAAEITESQARNFIRWTGRNPGSIQGQDFSAPGTTGWEKEVSHLKGWLEARSGWIDEQFFIPPTFNQYGGVVPEGFELTMSSDDATVYYTLDGSDPRAVGGGIALGATPFDGGPIDEVILAEDASCQYFVPLDDSLEASWFLSVFDDVTWFTGTSGLGFESSSGALNAEITTVIRDKMRPSANGSNNASCYFRYEFEFDNAASVNALLLEIKFDHAFVAYLNGVEVARSSLAPAGVVWNSAPTTSSGEPSDGNIVAYEFNGIADNSTFDYDISAFKNSVVDGTNVLAIQGMSSTSGSSDFLMKPRLSVNHTVTATPVVLNESATAVARAYDGQQWGAPTVATFVVGAELADASNLVVSEIMYNPTGPSAAEINAGFVDGDQFEYVELLNISASPVNLGDVSFTGGIDFNFVGAAVTELMPGGRVLIVSDQAAFEQRYGGGLNGLIAGEFLNDTALANEGERLAFTGASGVIHDFSYNDRYPWPESPDGDGPSLVLINADTNPDHATATNWRASVGPMGNAGAGDSVPFVGDPAADDDDDGLDAFAEHAFGTSDSTPDGAILVADFPGGGAFSVSYPRNLAADDALISVEVSQDLTTWMPPVEVGSGGETHNGDGTVTVNVTYPSTLSAGERLFVRLKVTSR